MNLYKSSYYPIIYSAHCSGDTLTDECIHTAIFLVRRFGLYSPNHYCYGNSGYGVLRLRTQNKIDLKVLMREIQAIF